MRSASSRTRADDLGEQFGHGSIDVIMNLYGHVHLRGIGRLWTDARPAGRRSEVIPRIRLVEGFVAERKVRDDVLEQCVGEWTPVEERRVHDLDTEKAARTVRHHPVNDRASPAFHETECRLEGRYRAQWRGQRSCRQALDGLPNQPHRLPGLIEAHEGSGFDVAGLEKRHAKLESSVGREGMIAPRNKRLPVNRLLRRSNRSRIRKQCECATAYPVSLAIMPKSPTWL